MARGHRFFLEAMGQVWAIEQTKGLAVAAFLARIAREDVERQEIGARKIPPKKEELIRRLDGDVALIEMHGVLSQRLNLMEDVSGGVSTDLLAGAIRHAGADPSYKAIVLHVDSPGGSIYGLPGLAAAVNEAKSKKAVIAQVDSMAASAAYWIASQATEIVASPGSDIGSIGVYALHEDVSGMLEREGIKETFIFAGKYKVEGNPYEPLSEDARHSMQARVDVAMKDFLSTVAEGRGRDIKDVEKNFGQGRLLEARDALKVGMIDRIASPGETLARFAKSASAVRKIQVEKDRRKIELLRRKD